MSDMDEKIKWEAGMPRWKEELYFADFFDDAQKRERQEKIRINIAENSTGRMLKNAFIGLVTGKTPKREKPEAEPWRPEYDNILLSFWTPKELKELKSKGFTKDQMVRHTKNYLIENAWAMDHWRTGTKEEYQAEIKRNPAYYLLEIVHFKDSKRGIPLEQWEYPDLKDTRINREELLGISPTRLAVNSELEQAVRNEFKKEKTEPVQNYTVDGMLLDSVIGKQALNILGQNDYTVDFAPMSSSDSVLVPHERRLTLNQNFSSEINALSVIKAACRIKQRQDGAEPTPQMDMDTYIASNVVCKADILTSQMIYAEEMRNKNPKILEAFKADGNKDLCDKFEASFAETNNLNTARSVAIDGYLDKTMPLTEAKRMNILQNWTGLTGSVVKSFSSKELLGNTCVGFDGKGYYNGKKATNEKFNVRGTPNNASMSDGSYRSFLSILKAKSR